MHYIVFKSAKRNETIGKNICQCMYMLKLKIQEEFFTVCGLLGVFDRNARAIHLGLETGERERGSGGQHGVLRA